MTRMMLAGLALMGLVACGQGNPAAAGADSAGQNLAVAGNDRPASRTLASGATIDVTMDRTITSRSDKAGETVLTTVGSDVRNSAGRVVIPAGSKVALTITEITPARNKSQADGTLTLQVADASIRGRSYPLAAEVTAVAHTLKGRGITLGEVEKVAVGTAIGVAVGQVIGKDTKGTIIGGVVGAASGAAVAIQTASRDVVVVAGTPLTLTLTGPLTVAAQ